MTDAAPAPTAAQLARTEAETLAADAKTAVNVATEALAATPEDAALKLAFETAVAHSAECEKLLEDAKAEEAKEIEDAKAEAAKLEAEAEPEIEHIFTVVSDFTHWVGTQLVHFKAGTILDKLVGQDLFSKGGPVAKTVAEEPDAPAA